MTVVTIGLMALGALVHLLLTGIPTHDYEWSGPILSGVVALSVADTYMNNGLGKKFAFWVVLGLFNLAIYL